VNEGPSIAPRATKVMLVILMAYILFGAIFYHVVEGWRWLDSFYFTVVTLATVGYGDFTPKTDAGKLFTMPFIFIGIGMFVYTANTFLRHRAETRLNKRATRTKGD